MEKDAIKKPRTILILLHQPDGPMSYDIEHYALRWQQAGHRVLYHYGPENVPPADIVMLHINLTVVPQAYIDAVREYPLVLNGAIRDISRRRFSRLILQRQDSFDGPVIVKTNANYGGYPELRSSGGGGANSARGQGFARLQSLLDRMRARRWRTLRALDPLAYPVFDHIKRVPPAVWANRNLVVERFIRDDGSDLFHTRYCIFFGNREIAGRLSSPRPVVKFGNAVSDVEIPVPDVVRQWRKNLGIDYGRFDYVVDNGTPYLIDVNKTEKGGALNYRYPKEMDLLASGLDFYLDCMPS